MSPAPIFQHPLAYLLGLQGVALMRAYAGDYDRDFTLARLAEVRALLDRADQLGDGVVVPPLPTDDGYGTWAPSYDGDNPFFAMDESQLLPILDALAPGVAADVACGTGRYTAHLAARGFDVRGFDTSPGMLEIARVKVPAADFGLAEMARLPIADHSVDIVVNTLALSHVEDLAPAFAEAARVLRPGGHLLVSDVRGYFLGSRRTPLLGQNELGPGYIPGWAHPTGEYLRAALAAGLVVRDCQELVAPVVDRPEDEIPVPPTPGEPASIWDLHPWAPVAARAVRDDRVCLITWNFVRE
ncbi:class I SAM-dependent methyltransferase [Nocardioides bizhenqiangii]|uniref:Class I SAM-dependent methyltransferase n=1 Tax=Nocardioides bizhenqiangii TaxID=3095076 RepID=A0ABZ0ZU98_9ACTN|nr:MULTISPECIES: class I SAM-dependent methyltransferase [unclassified Nocardioides]MDZ5621929.1 class I SAM-dependent methyltransferase [Nocardioides sp. HM23]WQQ27389.1 class I SAM-dependent methyltransferase [Nocardioides sp. HM61]